MKKTLLFALMLAVFLDIGNFFMPVPIYTPLFFHSPLLQAYSFEIKSILLGVLVASYGFAQLFGAPIFGELSDQYGRKKAILASMATAILGCFLAGISLTFSSLALIFISRLLIGFSSGTIAVVFAVAADNSTENEKAKNLGYINTGLSIGAAVGPIIGGHLVNPKLHSLLTYATPFYFMAALYFLNMLLLSKLLPPDKALRKGDKKIHLFTAFQNIYIALTRSRYLCFIVLTALFFQIGTEAFYLAAPVIGVTKLHMTPPILGNYFMLFGIIAAIVSWWVNAAIMRLWKNSNYIYLICIFLYTITISSLLMVNSYLTFLLPFLSVGIFGVLAWIQVNNLFSASVNAKEQGLIFGVSQSMWSLGGMIGTFLVGLSSAIHEKLIAFLPLLFIIFSLIFAVLIVINAKRTSRASTS